MTMIARNQMLGLVSAGVLLNFLVGIFASKIEKLIGIGPGVLAIITVLSLLLLSVVTYRIWLEERKALIPSIPSPASPTPGPALPVLGQRRWPLDHILAFIPMGMVAGAILAVVLVPLFDKMITLPIYITVEGESTPLRWCCTYELVGILLLLVTAIVVAVRWHGMAALLLLLSSITAFTAMFTVLRPYEQNFLLSLVAWGLSAVLVFVIVRGIAALLGK